METVLRAGIFLLLLGLLLALERRWPRRGDPARPRQRWTANLGLGALGAVLLPLVPGAGAVGAAIWAAQAGLGLLPATGLPMGVQALAGLVLLDLLLYGQHRLTHAWSPLWRLHRVHHSDTKLDTTSALRFHPVEILLSMLLKMGAVTALGVPPGAVLLFEVLLNALSLFNHADLRLPPRLEAVLRYLLATPDWHRVHHSVHADEQHCNFAFGLTLWDRCFGSAREQPRDGHASMRIGLLGFRSESEQKLAALLVQPLRYTEIHAKESNNGR